MIKKSCKHILVAFGIYPFLKALRQVVIYLFKKMDVIRCLMNRKSIINRYFSKNKNYKLNIGCGLNIIEGWLNADIAPVNKEVLFLDATNFFPFKNETFDYIYSEHMIEHITYTDGIKMIKECYRVLKRGGKLRIATPDLRFLINLYHEPRSQTQEQYMIWVMNKYFLDINSFSVTQVINNFFYNFGHQFIYDFKTIKFVLTQSGFKNCAECKVGDSTDTLLKNLEAHGKFEIPDAFNALETFIIEAEK